MIRETGKLTGREPAAESMIDDIRQQFAILSKKRATHSRKKVAYLIWKDPLMAAGANTYIDDMLQHCGFENVFASMHRYPIITMEDLKHARPDVILLSSEPYPFREPHMEELSNHLHGIDIRLVDGEMFSWYGSRMLRAATYLTELASMIR